MYTHTHVQQQIYTNTHTVRDREREIERGKGRQAQTISIPFFPQKNCSTELDNVVKYDFPGYTVKVKHKTFLCEGHNGDNIVLLRLHLSPTKEQEDSGTELQRMLECSGHLPSGKDSEPCSYYTTNSPPVRDKSTFDRDLIAVLVTVFVAVEMLVLAVLMYWKRKEVTTLAKRWTAQCR